MVPPSREKNGVGTSCPKYWARHHVYARYATASAPKLTIGLAQAVQFVYEPLIGLLLAVQFARNPANGPFLAVHLAPEPPPGTGSTAAPRLPDRSRHSDMSTNNPLRASGMAP